MNRMTRAEQRRRTEARILDAARTAFSEHGYDRTTIRGIARAAGVNPGLVMHYFGAKETLFAQAITTPPDEPAEQDEPAPAAERLLDALRTKLVEEPTATLAMLRSMLTHPDAAEGVRSTLNSQQHQLSAAVSQDDAMLRTSLTGAITLGVVVARHLLQLDGLRDAEPERVAELLRPCFESLVGQSGAAR